MAGVPRIAADLLQRPRRQPYRAISRLMQRSKKLSRTFNGNVRGRGRMRTVYPQVTTVLLVKNKPVR
jgi:hypothetical protein